MIRNYQHCEFESERRVFAFLEKSLPATTDIVVFPNYNLFDVSKSAYLECDAIVVTRGFVAIVELKDWAGSVTVSEPKWKRGAAIIESPHIANNRKCKVLKSVLQHTLKGVAESRIPYVQSVVALTSESSEVEGASSSKQVEAVASTVTLDGVAELSDYLKRRLHQHSSVGRELTHAEFQRLVQQLEINSQSTKIDYADQVPGYRVIEDRGPTAAYITYVAERKPNIDNRLYRLRVFGKLSEDLQTRERQLRSLKALAALPHHPGIRSVQSHPNERNLIVEVSDWSDTKTLEDVLLEQGRLDWRSACTVVRDIAAALNHVHESAAGLVHRNVCPKSILLSSDFHAQLTDFDLTFDPSSDLSVVGEHAEERLAQDYSAPEALAGNVDFKSDVYSLGVVLHHAVTGAFPAERLNSSGKLFADEDLPGCDDQDREALTALVGQMLAQAQSARPSANNVFVAIDEILRSEGKGKHKDLEVLDEATSYTSVSKIAEGVSADVYRVDNHGDVFIHKVFKADMPREQALQERDVLRAVGRLNLPILFPRVRHFSERSGHRWCLATDFVPGEPLKKRIENGHRPSVETFLRVSKVLLEAMVQLHASHDDTPPLIHNDINPNNVLIDDNSGAVGLIDFGCATASGVVSVRGTPGYVDSSLVSRGEMNACPQGDLYALAKTLSEWLWGRVNLSSPVEAPSERTGLPAISKWLSRAVGSEAARYQSAREMLDALENLISEVDSSGTPSALERIDTTPASPVEAVSASTEKITVPHEAVAVELNGFVSYLNTLHNVGAGNANALAEFQSVSQFFGSIYEPIAIADDIHRRLISNGEAVVVLSGHAGDGKSTIALDILKQLKRQSSLEPLAAPPRPIETERIGAKDIHIVKDMSEHTAERRLETFKQSLQVGSGSWLIVSNTGPLLNTLVKANPEIEQSILQLLDRPIANALHDETHLIKGFEKPIYVANLSKLDNVQTAVNVLERITSHASWSQCKSCPAYSSCPIHRNVATVKNSAELGQRVAWLYRLLTSYERRLTMRQMTAQLAYSITGGMDCASVISATEQFGAAASFRKNLFSELFFGYSDGEAVAEARNLYCVRQLHQLASEGRTRPSVELRLQRDIPGAYAAIEDELKPVLDHWRNDSTRAASGTAARAAIRRLVFMFGRQMENAPSREWWADFVEDFSGSPKLRQWEGWRNTKALPESASEKRSLVRQILSVIGEHCTGFASAPGANTKLLVTLRRDDMETTQPVQVVIGEYDESDFRLEFDQAELTPRLMYLPSSGAVFMRLPLPLLDFVSRRSIGDFGQDLDPIYINQLDLFCSQLVATKPLPEEDIRLLTVGVTGGHRIFRVAIDNKRMEII